MVKTDTLRKIQQLSLILLKVVLLTFFILSTSFQLHTRFSAIDGTVAILVFLGVWAMSAIALMVVAFSPHISVRLIWGLLFCLAALVNDSYQQIMGTYMGIQELERLLLLAEGFAHEAINFYWPYIMKTVQNVAIGLIAILLPVKLLKIRNRATLLISTVIPLVPIAVVSTIIYVRGGHGSDGLPSSINPLAFMTILGYDAASKPPVKPRRLVTLSATQNSVKDLIYIMDESIRGDMLDINSKEGVVTYLSLGRSDIFNFGLAASISNCSGATNAAVRYGSRKRSYLSDLQVNPSFWVYAKKAGFTTVYIDGQRKGGAMQNLMDEDERKKIDLFIQFGDIDVAQRDMKILETIILLTREPARHFIYVNKMGAHFPFEGKYPKSRAVYTPRMEQTYFGDSGDPDTDYGSIPQFGDTAFINSYKNVLAWSVGEFWRRLLPQLDLSNSIVTYTADHGQNFQKRDGGSVATHCNGSKAAANEGVVPLVVATQIQPYKSLLKEGTQYNYNMVSHFNLFATHLIMMGYPRQAVESFYDLSLFSEIQDPPKFLAVFFVRFGKKPVWRSIN